MFTIIILFSEILSKKVTSAHIKYQQRPHCYWNVFIMIILRANSNNRKMFKKVVLLEEYFNL